jgi:hypothetical protein
LITVYDRHKPKPTTFTVPQRPQPMRDKSTTPQPLRIHNRNPTRNAPPWNPAILQVRREDAKVGITLLNGRDFLGVVIVSVERHLIEIKHQGKGRLDHETRHNDDC